MSSRPRGPLARAASPLRRARVRAGIALVAAVGVIAVQAIAPLSSASAQIRATQIRAAQTVAKPPTHRPSRPADRILPKTRPAPWSAKTAKPAIRRHNVPNAAALRRQALAQAAAREKIATYRVSPAFLTFLTKGLGLRLGTNTEFTGVRSNGGLKVSLPAPQGLRLGLPAGMKPPSFGRSTLTIDRATGAATLTASASDATLTVTVPDAASSSMGSLSSHLTLRLPVLGETVPLSGTVSYQQGAAASASLSGQLTGADDLKPGVAELDPGTTVTLNPQGGLRIAGPASLGPLTHRLMVTVAGTITQTTQWTFAVDAASGQNPLPGLTLSRAASGTVTDTHGRIGFDVKASTARPWTTASGTTVAGAVTFSDRLPEGKLIPAPGITGTTPWLDITGTITTDGISTHGTAAINLNSGQGLLTTSGTTPVTLSDSRNKLIHDDAGFRGTLDVSPAGHITDHLPARLSTWASSRPAGIANPRYAGKIAASTGDGTYTLSNAVYDFITNNLNVPLGSATLSGGLSGSTLTVTAGAPTALPSSLPSWIPDPSYVNTQISVDVSTGTLTLTAATGTSTGEAATLTVTMTSDLSDVSGSLVLTGVPFTGGSTASLTFGLGYANGALTATLNGSLTSAATFANGAVILESGATLTLATGSGLSLTGVADIDSATVAVNGTLTDLKNWSLTVSDANAPVWQPATGLTVTPDFTGTISDAAGSVGFDLTSTGPGVATWVSPDGSSSVSVTSLEVSNQAPSSPCSSVKAGDLWIGINGSYGYAPANLNLNASGCFDLTGKTATITTAATGNLTSEFGSGLPFSVTSAGLTATVASGGTFSLTGTATVSITQGISGNPAFNVGMVLSNDGIVAAAQIPDLTSLGFSGSGVLYVASAANASFDPASLGITGQPTSVSLPAGLAVSMSYTLSSTDTSDLQKVIPGFPSVTAVQAMASLSASGFTVDFGLNLGTGAGGLQVDNSGFYLDGIDMRIALGSQNQITLSGSGYLELPALAPGGSPSQVGVTVGGSFNINSLSLGLFFNLSDWNNALGVSGLNVQDFGGTLAVTLESGIPTPSLGINGSNIVLPASWATTIGMVPGTEISFNANISLTQPVLGLTLVNPNGPEQPVLTPLALAGVSAAEADSFAVDEASFELAPDGGVTPAGDVLQPGVSLIFNANLDNVPVHLDAAVDLAAPSVTATADVGAFTIGPIQTSATEFHLAVSPASLEFKISGGISYNNNTFNASVAFQVGTSMNGASVSLSLTGGLPWYFQGGVSLTGSVTGDGSGAQINASGSGWLTAAGQTLGPVSFSFSLPGSLNWSDIYNSLAQLGQFFIDAGLSSSDILQALEQFGYSVYDAFNELSQLGVYGQEVLDGLNSVFGFSSTYYNIWNETSAAETLTMDVEDGSQSPNANVITYDWNGGYNQDWEFMQSPYSGWYEIVNRGSGQCLTVYGNVSTPGSPLIQYPCAGASNQLWYMGNIALDTNYVITSALDYQVVDIQNAYPWPGGYFDQWPYNGGWNQQFYLTNSSNA